jgi:hypothetical protein
VSVLAVLASVLYLPTNAFVPSVLRQRLLPARLQMAIDYNDPVVTEEFGKVQPMSYEDVEAELQAKGIPVPPTMK